MDGRHFECVWASSPVVARRMSRARAKLRAGSIRGRDGDARGRAKDCVGGLGCARSAWSIFEASDGTFGRTLLTVWWGGTAMMTTRMAFGELLAFDPPVFNPPAPALGRSLLRRSLYRSTGLYEISLVYLYANIQCSSRPLVRGCSSFERYYFE